MAGDGLYEQIYSMVKAIPYGRVASYGQVAAAIGHPRAARVVGMALARCQVEEVPWQRVINRHGMISIENMRVEKRTQAELLESEGVEVEMREGNYFVDMGKYGVNLAGE